jgi:hypothetical protein
VGLSARAPDTARAKERVKDRARTLINASHIMCSLCSFWFSVFCRSVEKNKDYKDVRKGELHRTLKKNIGFYEKEHQKVSDSLPNNPN